MGAAPVPWHVSIFQYNTCQTFTGVACAALADLFRPGTSQTHARWNSVPRGATPHHIVSRVYQRSVHRALFFRFSQE